MLGRSCKNYLRLTFTYFGVSGAKKGKSRGDGRTSLIEILRVRVFPVIIQHNERKHFRCWPKHHMYAGNEVPKDKNFFCQDFYFVLWSHEVQSSTCNSNQLISKPHKTPTHTISVPTMQKAGTDPGLWSGGGQRRRTLRALSPKIAQNRGFSLKITWKWHDFEEILGARGPGPQGPPRSATEKACKIRKKCRQLAIWIKRGPLYMT